MSRIFDALQRSGAEQTGVEYPDMVSVATALFEPHVEPEAQPTATESAAEPTQTQVLPGNEDRFLAEAGATTADTNEVTSSFPALDMAVLPASPLVFLTQPESLAAEKFRFLGVRLRQMRQHRQLKKVLVTSTLPEEGKSLVSANLAGVLALRKEKVLLVEGDMRRPVFAENMGLGRLAGLTEWLQGGAETLSNIYQLRGPQFWIMPAGDPPANPLELMQSARLPLLVAQLTTLFDWIIVDSPPLLPLADTTVWNRLTDGTLLVVREGTSEKGPLQKGLETIRKADLLGVVLNGSTETDHDSYYRRYSPSTAK